MRNKICSHSLHRKMQLQHQSCSLAVNNVTGNLLYKKLAVNQAAAGIAKLAMDVAVKVQGPRPITSAFRISSKSNEHS